VRFERFRTDEGGKAVARRPSRDAAAGEAAFLDVLLGDDSSEKRQRAAIAALERAIKRDQRDGRSRMLLGLLHMYRFSRETLDVAAASPAAQAEIRDADDLLQQARALLWDGTRGDSRVLGFAGPARYLLGVATHAPDLRARGLADVAEAVRVNTLFSGFDYAVVVASEPRASAGFAEDLALFDGYVSGIDPSCFVTLPELCSNAGMAI
jgi:hypothetical protein